ncbi:hypothetical protein QUF70_08400 [Desulfobacterales bacterium HSG17]|nr:hypothetical protein [Desulfobacterales bacterium HSG17]
MELIDKQYIIDENNKKIAVQVSIENFIKIEQILEDHALYHLMQDNTDTDLLELDDAQAFYEQLAKES